MNYSDLISSPTTIGGAIFSIIAIAVYLYYTRYASEGEKIDRVPVFLFNYTKQVRKLMASTFDGLVSYRTGGFVEDHSLAVDYRSGRVKRRGHEGIKSKRRTTCYVARLQSITALDLNQKNNRPGRFDKERYTLLKRTTRQRAVDEGKILATRSDFAGKLLTIGAVITALLTGAAWLFVVVAPSIA